jgi:hypothetical protein
MVDSSGDHSRDRGSSADDSYPGINASLAGFAAGEVPSIPVVEVRV